MAEEVGGTRAAAKSLASGGDGLPAHPRSPAEWPALLLLVIVILGYGIPIGNSWLAAGPVRRSDMDLRLQAEFEAEPGSVPARAWLGRYVIHASDGEAAAYLQQVAENDKRDGVRFVAIDWLARYYRHNYADWSGAADAFLLDPTANLRFRNALLLEHDWLDLTGDAQALVEQQATLFPHPETTVLRPIGNDLMLEKARAELRARFNR